jgi:photosystem II stability/assembly factor-like uncharacterized protein
MSRLIQALRAPRSSGLAVLLLTAAFVLPSCVNNEEVLSINKINLSFTRAKVIDLENENQPPDLDGDGSPDSPRYRPGDVVRKTVTVRNGSARNIPLRIFVDSEHPTALHGGAFRIDTERSPPAEEGIVDAPFNYLLESNAELEVTILFEGLVEGINIGRLQIISGDYQERERCEGMDTAGCIEVVLQGTVDCTSLHTDEANWDADLDGYCVAPEGFELSSEEDCEDRPEVEGWRASPGLREEVCEVGESQLDTDCDGTVELITDRDSDGFCDLLDDVAVDENGNPVVRSCTTIPDNGEDWSYAQALAAACGLDPDAVAGQTLDEWLLNPGDDCEDSSTDSDGNGVPDSAAIFPGHLEVCEPGGIAEQRDSNCSPDDDEPSAINWPPSGMLLYHRDRDGDTYGAVDATTLSGSDPDAVWHCGGSPSDEFTPARLDLSNPSTESCSSNGGCSDGAACVAGICQAYIEDCADDDVERFPEAPVRCNGIDDDCDGIADQILDNPPALRDDSDSDADGRPICSGEECSDPALNSDNDPTVYDGAPELCDGKDNDCDGVVPTAPGVDETDDDTDNYIPCHPEPLVLEICRCSTAYEQSTFAACDPQANPPVTQFCMPLSCNLAVGAASNPEYCANGTDDDGDGLSDCEDPDCNGTPVCSPSGPNCALGSGDCDDFDQSVSPGAEEENNGVSLCDFEDNDCDGLLHPTETDDDGDGNPFLLGSGTECGPDGDIASTNDNDCNDTIDTVFAGAGEICDGIDNDCNGAADFNSGGLDELDNDGDGYVACQEAVDGNGNSRLVGFAGGDDCNDDANDPVASNVYPFAPEIPDSYWDNGTFRWVDNQCPGNAGHDSNTIRSPGEYCFSSVTSSALNCSDPTFACMACAAGSETDTDQDGFTEAQGDCDDTLASRYPGASEICDGIDNNCDNFLMGAETDGDLDGYVTCWPPPGSPTLLLGGDCDDTQNGVNPSATEGANGIDDDCNGLVDDGTTNFDDDGDGVTEAGPDGNIATTADNDCDDSDANNYPGNTEICDGLDNDCNDAADYSGSDGDELDADGDGYSQCADGDCLDSGAQLLVEISTYPSGSSASDIAHRTAVAASIHPNAPQLCDGWTNDCSEQTSSTALAYIPVAGTQPNEFDNDQDGFVECDDGGHGAWSAHAAHANRLLNGGNDCLDIPSNSYADQVNPGADPSDVCDGYDTDCSNGASSSTPDQSDERDDDGDSWIHCDVFVSAAINTGGLGLLGGGDCLDEAANTWSNQVSPGAAVERCDGYDTNCTGGGSTHTPDDPTENDDDGDGYVECDFVQNSLWVDPPGGGTLLGGDDCLDVSLSTNSYSDDVSPGATEVCDGHDTDCSTGSANSFPEDPAENDEDSDRYIECSNFVSAAATSQIVGGDDCLDDSAIGGLPPYSIAVNPGASELCDGYDTNCSSGASAADVSSELDDDNDGYIECSGFEAGAIAVGENHPQNLAGGGDCLDQVSNSYSASVNPNASELCDGYDTNCSGNSGSNPDVSTENDDDDDGYIECTSFVSAAAGTGTQVLTGGGDCLDVSLSSNSYSDDVRPGANDVCDGYDTDCSTGTSLPENTLEVDNDGDGYVACPSSLPFQASAANTGGLGLIDGEDCLDVPLSSNSYSNSVNPGASELCDGYDTDCFGGLPADEDDTDSDQYIECSGFVSGAAGTTSANLLIGVDCDGSDGLDFPGGVETCNADDEDCDGAIDNGFDGDGDGVTQCGADGSAGNADDDCDDADNANFPGNPEVCDGQDNDCDTSVDQGLDIDGDGFTPCGVNGVVDGLDDDCDDSLTTGFAINPSAAEVCDGVDNDCALGIDDGFDVDGDGFTTCGVNGVVDGLDDDCDDADILDFPGGIETCNADDEDCDGAIDNGFDGDGDGITTCGVNGVIDGVDDDCDDTTTAVNPSETEVCDGLDNDCDTNFGPNEPTTPGAVTLTEDSSALCTDNLDNDCNGLVDAAEATCGWQSQTTPTSDALNSVFVRSATRVHVVGEGGTILITVNGGSAWTVQASGIGDNLNSVYFTSNSTGWAVGNNGAILATSNSGSTWSPQTSGLGNGDNLYSVHFTSPIVGWAVGAGGIVLTTSDAGVTWSDVSASVTGGSTQELSGVFFATSSTGWIVGDNSQIFATGDGGVTWVAQTNGVPTGTVLTGVTAVSATAAWISSNSGKVLSTTDGGTTWAETNTGGSIHNGLSFVDANEGWVIGNGPQVFVTVDGGVSFTEQTPLPTTELLRAVSFANGEDGWAVGESGTIIHTTSGGD